MVDHFVVTEALSRFGFDVTKHGEQIIGCASSTRRQVATKEVFQDPAAVESSLPSGPRHAVADQRSSRLHTIHESLFHRRYFAFGTSFRTAHEDVGGEIEGECLQRCVCTKSVSGGPCVERRVDCRIENVDRLLDPSPSERLLHDSTMP